MDPIKDLSYRKKYVQAWRKVMRMPKDGVVTCGDQPPIFCEFLRAKFVRELNQRINQRIM
jgi:hypothetical protein